MSVILDALAEATSTVRDPAEWLLDSMGGKKTTSGERVSSESALSISSYFAAMRAISEDIGKLPFVLYKLGSESGRNKAVDHAAYKVLRHRWNPWVSAQSGRETMTHHAMGWGNGFAEIVRSPRNEISGGAHGPFELYNIHPSRVSIETNMAGRPRYILRGLPDSVDSIEPHAHVDREIPYENMLHLHGFGGTGFSGYSILHYAKESLGLNIAIQKFTASFYGNSTVFGGIMSPEGMMNEKQRDFIIKQLQGGHEGADRAHKIFLSPVALKWHDRGMPPKDAQTLELNIFSIYEIARWFRIPVSKLQEHRDTSGHSESEINRMYVADTLMPWDVRWAAECKAKLFSSDENLYAEHKFDELLRGDPKARGEYLMKRFQAGTLAPDEWRSLENENPFNLPGTDEPWVQGAMIPLTTAAKAGPPNIQQKTSRTGNTEESGERGRPGEKGKSMIDLDRYSVLFVDISSRLSRKEAVAHSKAIKRNVDSIETYRQWVGKFYIDFQHDLYNAFSPVMISIFGFDRFRSIHDYFKESINSFCESRKKENIKNENWSDENAVDDATQLMAEAFMGYARTALIKLGE